MKLSISQKNQFFDDGYLIINNFFNQLEVGAMLKEMYCLIENKHGRNRKKCENGLQHKKYEFTCVSNTGFNRSN